MLISSTINSQAGDHEVPDVLKFEVVIQIHTQLTGYAFTLK